MSACLYRNYFYLKFSSNIDESKYPLTLLSRKGNIEMEDAIRAVKKNYISNKLPDPNFLSPKKKAKILKHGRGIQHSNNFRCLKKG